MAMVGANFDPEVDRCIANLRQGSIIGGFVFQNYTGADGSIAVHMAGRDARWCSRDLLWMCFDYCFNQLGVHKIIAPVPGYIPLSLNLVARAGYTPEAFIEHAFPGGYPLFLLSMTREQCRWLTLKPPSWRRNYEVVNGQG
jgi:RimJ/RimL family protein N-acetyltransferase